MYPLDHVFLQICAQSGIAGRKQFANNVTNKGLASKIYKQHMIETRAPQCSSQHCL